MSLPFVFDFKKPDYLSVFRWRAERLAAIRANPAVLPALKAFYKNNIAQFISDWGMTLDPRNPEIGQPAMIPFILYPRQKEWVEWFLERWRLREPGLSDKSREMGLTWLAGATVASICLFNDNVSGGFGSRKVDYVDVKGNPDSIFEKIRIFIRSLPQEFRGGWNDKNNGNYMKITFPNTGSIITGEGGDGIGRGGRQSFYFVDESAFLPRPSATDASLSMTTNCRMDISTPRGMNNPFAVKRFGGNISVFSMRWQDDPRKDKDWYDRKCKQLDYDPVVIAQELDLDYTASVSGILIPAAWVAASIDAHIHLGIKPSGIRKAALDIADEGRDLDAYAGRHGVLLEYLESWKGKGSDIYETVEKAITLSDVLGYKTLTYDADGLGAGARGDARKINEKRKYKIEFLPFHGSGKVIDPEEDVYQREYEEEDQTKARLNADFFGNRKAQEWWRFRRRFLDTYRAVVLKEEFNPDTIISISSKLPEYHKLVAELSQPTYAQNDVGKIIINKNPEGSKSPNLADTAMMLFSKEEKPSWGFGSDDYAE